MSATAPDPFRLPARVAPERYDLVLEPDLEAAAFEGTVRIRLQVTEPTAEIVFNAKELEVRDARLTGSDGAEVPIDRVSLDPALERATLSLGRSVDVGAFELKIGFRGILNDKLAGFYRSTFTDETGHKHTLATTQLQATDARRAFPCFDEPAFKAVFGVTLVVPTDLLAVSNAPIVFEEATGTGKRRVRFADTPRMSTYLVAFVVGPLEATEPVGVGGIPLRIIHPIGKAHLTRYALEAGAFALRYFQEYYGVPYPGRKLDLVAVPDFAFGAMENLGCVTFREVLLLVDETRATQSELLRVADVIAHEIAHMWFGDLVTMRWWNGTWLNEAFATFMEVRCTDAFRPEWRRWDQFSRERSAAFDVDALASTRAVEYPVRSPAEAEGMFDVLTYEKGASVLRMLEQYLGEERFREGVRRYLARHAFGNTETHDLWDALEDAAGEPVRRIMESWIFQPGFPRLSAALEGGRLAVTQERFAYLAPKQPDESLWSVPLVVRCDSGSQSAGCRELLESQTTTLDLPAAPKWALLNAGSHGFYRVAYSPELLGRLSEHLAVLEPAERYALVDDAWASVLTGSTRGAEFLSFAERFAGERDLDVWASLTGCLASLERLLEGEARKRYRDRVGALVRPALEALGWSSALGEPPRTVELRGLLVRSLAVTANDGEALVRSRVLHDAYLADPLAVEPNLASAAAAAVASRGTASDYEAFARKCEAAPTPQEERRYRFLLAAFPGEAEMTRTLGSSLDGTVRTQDAPYLLQTCLENRDRGAEAWRFVRENWEKMLAAFPDNAITRMLSGARALTDPEVAADVLAFFAGHPLAKGQKHLDQHLEKLRVNLALRERERERFVDALLGAH